MMKPLKYVHVLYEYLALVFVDGRFVKLMQPGRHWVFEPLGSVTVFTSWQRQPWIELPESLLRQLSGSETVREHAEFIDLGDHQRALIWLNGRFHGILEPGLYAYWKDLIDVVVEVVDARRPRLSHPEVETILARKEAMRHLHHYEVAENTGRVVYVDGCLTDVLGPGSYGYWKNGLNVRALPFNLPWLNLPANELKQLRASEQLDATIAYVDVADQQRALVWFNGHFGGILGPGLYARWREGFDARIQFVEATEARFVFDELDTVVNHGDASRHLHVHEIPDEKMGVLYLNGQFAELLPAGRYAFWQGVGKVKLYQYDLREKVLDVTGQEIMTADKVTLRLNAVMTYRVVDVRKVSETVENAEQALYRELQLIVRGEVGGRTLDQLLADKTAVANDALVAIKAKAEGYGLEVKGLGIRDVILPGDMKTLLNQVIEAEKAAQANVIKRREETAALRSQLNSAKLIQDNPTLMRLRELETLEKIVEKTQMQIFVGDQSGLSDRILKLI